MRKKWKILLPIVITMVVILLIVVNKNEQQAVVSQNDAKAVGVWEAKKEKLANLFELSGTLQPIEEVIVSFEVGGRILTLYHKVGDVVKQGDVLAVLDDKDYQERLAQAEGGLKQAAAGLQQTQNGARNEEIEQVKAMVDKLSVLYQKMLQDFSKMEEDYRNLKVSKNEYDQARLSLEVTRKDLEAAKQGYAIALQGARTEVKDQSKAAYDQALAGRNQAALLLEKNRLKAPINGTLIQKPVSVGQLVGAGSPVYKIGDVSKLKVTLSVPDYEIGNWKIGDAVQVKLYQRQKVGKVNNILPATQEGTGTVGVEVVVDNPERDWLSGQVVQCVHAVDTAESIYVPVAAVNRSGDGRTHVFLVKNGLAVKTSVKTGLLLHNRLEILSGMQAGDVVVVKGADRLLGNEKVTPMAGDAT